MKEEAIENLRRERCPFCGGFLSDKPFYSLERHVCVQKVWICPNCKKRVIEWF